MATTYTSADKVANKLGFPSGYFGASSTPTSLEIEEFINEAEDSIDSTTKHAWRTKTITKEYVEPSSIYRYGTGIRLDLVHRSNVTLTKLEIWNNNEWEDWIADKTAGRDKDYWVDEVNGVVFLNTIYRLYPHGVRVTYTFGETEVPKTIQKAATLIAALDVLDAPEFFAVNFTQSGDNRPDYSSTRESWEKKIEKILDNNTEFQ